MSLVSLQSIGNETGELGNKRTSGDHPKDNIIKMGQDTEKSPGDLRRLALTQTPVEDHQLIIIIIIPLRVFQQKLSKE